MKQSKDKITLIDPNCPSCRQRLLNDVKEYRDDIKRQVKIFGPKIVRKQLGMKPKDKW